MNTGKWTAHTTPVGDHWPVSAEYGDRRANIAVCSFEAGYGVSKEEALANARLIAAAPELVAALKAMVKHFGVLEYNEMVHPVAQAASKQARAALAKVSPQDSPPQGISVNNKTLI
jgi:hypothetical protein